MVTCPATADGEFMSVAMLPMVPYLASRPAFRAPVPLWAGFLGLFLGFAAVRPAHAVWLDRHEAIMGTNIDVEIWHDEAKAGNAAIDAVMDEMRRIDNLMSHYKPESQISQI